MSDEQTEIPSDSRQPGPQTTATDGTCPTGGGGGSNARKTASSLAFLTFFKSLFGAGLLALPNALGEVGLPLGSVIYFSVTLACALSTYLLLRAREVTQDAYYPAPIARRESSGETEEGGGGCEGDEEVDEYMLYELTAEGEGGETKSESDDERRRPLHRLPPRTHLATYGDLADVLMGPLMASVTRWTIIVLNILFTSGLIIVICENLGGFLMEMGDVSDDDREKSVMAYRHAVGVAILPVVAVLLQIPWLQDMWVISAIGLAVYSVGVVGSTLYSALVTIFASIGGDNIQGDDGNSGVGVEGMPTDLWSLKWEKIPTFLGSAVYALEGINLALPVVHSMNKPSDGPKVVCSALLLYGVITLTFAAVGYAGGLGGGEGTGKTQDECDVVTNCLTPPYLRSSLQLALSFAMILSVPVMLYPSTEMLEVMLTDWSLQRKEKRWWQKNMQRWGWGWEDPTGEGPRRTSSGVLVGAGGGTAPSSETALMTTADHDQYSDGFGSDDSGSVRALMGASGTAGDAITAPDVPSPDTDGYSQNKSWRLRLFLALLTTTLGTVLSRSFTAFSGVVGAVGLSFAGFVLPPLLYHRAMLGANLRISRTMMLSMVALILFGVYNMIVGGVSSLTQLVRKS